MYQITAALLIAIISMILSTVTLLVVSKRVDKLNNKLSQYKNHQHKVVIGTTIPGVVKIGHTEEE